MRSMRKESPFSGGDDGYQGEMTKKWDLEVSSGQGGKFRKTERR